MGLIRVFKYDEFLAEGGGYPAGAANDPRAPYNQKDPEQVGKSGQPLSGIPFQLLGHTTEFALCRNKSDYKAMFIAYLYDNDELEQYKPYTSSYVGRDEDGAPIEDREPTGDIDEDGIEAWLWNDVAKDDIGEGYDDYESGDHKVVKLDDNLAQELYDDFCKWSSEKYRSEHPKFGRRSSNEELAYKDMAEDIKEVYPDVKSDYCD